MTTLDRRRVLTAAVLAATVGAAEPVAANEFAPALGERAEGAADAPVTIVAYHSMTCPACAKFKRETWPAFKAKYVETGRVRVVWKDFPLDRVALQLAKLARCVGAERHSAYMSLVYQRQPELLRGPDAVAGAARLARLAGLSEEGARACLADKAVEDDVLKETLEGQSSNVRSTPTFVIRGRAYPGELHLDEFDRILTPMLGAAR